MDFLLALSVFCIVRIRDVRIVALPDSHVYVIIRIPDDMGTSICNTLSDRFVFRLDYYRNDRQRHSLARVYRLAAFRVARIVLGEYYVARRHCDRRSDDTHISRYYICHCGYVGVFRHPHTTHFPHGLQRTISGRPVRAGVFSCNSRSPYRHRHMAIHGATTAPKLMPCTLEISRVLFLKNPMIRITFGWFFIMFFHIFLHPTHGSSAPSLATLLALYLPPSAKEYRYINSLLVSYHPSSYTPSFLLAPKAFASQMEYTGPRQTNAHGSLGGDFTPAAIGAITAVGTRYFITDQLK